MPELIYNMDLLIETTEEEIVRNDRQRKFLKVINIINHKNYFRITTKMMIRSMQ